MNDVTYPKILSRSDYLKAFAKIAEPAIDQLTEEHPGLLSIGTSGTIYSEKIREAEGFLRLLWGYAPYYQHHPIDETFERLIEGICRGVDPADRDYWGDIDDINQLMVEMTPLAIFLMMNQTKVEKSTTKDQREKIYQWLSQINKYQTPQNNWLFFRVLVNACLAKQTNQADYLQMEKDLKKIESFYLGNGWYFDGVKQQKDYYISFAIHYYSLLYAVLFEKEDPKRSRLFKERAAKFASSFQEWFDGEGRGVPFGRSLTYRFAQGSFWSAMLFAKVEGFDLSIAKSLLGKNLRFWFSQNIFSTDGLLKIGYCYENLVMAEEYNGPGSPYWALKAFLVLALPESDDVWQLTEVEDDTERQTVIKEADMLMVHSEKNQHLQCFPAGQFVHLHTHGEAKYSKFVYSTLFGFNVSNGLHGLEKGCFDNVLAVSERDDFYRVRTQAKAFEVTDNFARVSWHPWDNVSITSWIVPFDSWHFRIHLINSERLLSLVDGGFSVPNDGPESICEEDFHHGIMVHSKVGVSGTVSLIGESDSKISYRNANVNVLYNNVAFPYLTTETETGRTLICNAFYGGQQAKNIELPKAIEEAGTIRLQVGEKSQFLSLETIEMNV
ncbi:DUF2264 domain-containing protein [Enterococcus hulanensis]|uniref:DUF2264 domain-containing protein n=1 Tax=Enterococcus hulanensis TaxID=2559929 RepID=UPI00288F174A|nr:DUF2264 domain-containing protein [Enterococcus hulanensis]MDT2660527.1 DUF2264 domain-containing protein [Enterococcus hulanensis]